MLSKLQNNKLTFTNEQYQDYFQGHVLVIVQYLLRGGTGVSLLMLIMYCNVQCKVSHVSLIVVVIVVHNCTVYTIITSSHYNPTHSSQ